MTLKTLENGMVADDFSFKTKFGPYTDALVMTPEEYAALTPEQIVQMKSDRVSRWVESVEIASQEVSPESTEEPTPDTEG